MSDAAAPVALYAEEHRLLQVTLRKRLEAALASKSLAITSGLAKTFDDYRYRIGEIQGLQDAIAICQAVEKELSRD